VNSTSSLAKNLAPFLIGSRMTSVSEDLTELEKPEAVTLSMYASFPSRSRRVTTVDATLTYSSVPDLANLKFNCTDVPNSTLICPVCSYKPLL
jgi:hypothetical protein